MYITVRKKNKDEFSFLFSILIFIACLHTLHLGSNNLGLLLPGNHDLEPVEVTEVSSDSLGGELLGPAGLGPCLGDSSLLPGGLDAGGAGSAADLAGEVGEGDAAEGDDLAGDSGVASVDQALVAVDHVADGGKLALVLSVVDQADPSDLNEASKNHLSH